MLERPGAGVPGSDQQSALDRIRLSNDQREEITTISPRASLARVGRIRVAALRDWNVDRGGPGFRCGINRKPMPFADLLQPGGIDGRRRRARVPSVIVEL